MHAGGNKKTYPAGTRGEWWLENCGGGCGKSVNTCGDKIETMWAIGWVSCSDGWLCKECAEITRRVVKRIRDTDPNKRRDIPISIGGSGVSVLQIGGGGPGGVGGFGGGGNGGSGSFTVQVVGRGGGQGGSGGVSK